MNSTLALLNLFPGHIYSKDINGLYLTSNPTYLRTVGFSSYSQLIGNDDHFVVGERYADELVDNDKFVIRKSAEIFIIEKGPTQNKKGGDYLSKKVPLYDESRNIIGLFGYSIGVTKKNFKLGELIIENIPNSGENHLNDCKKLSLRQIECLHYLLRGMTNKQVGTMLGISSRTVESYLEEVKVKLNCNNKAELIQKLFQVSQIALNSNFIHTH